MKKLYISQPMNGLDEEVILRTRDKMHKIAEVIFGEELEVIDSYNSEFEHEVFPGVINNRIIELGKNICFMAYADYVITINEDWLAPGTRIEKEVACNYNIPRYYVGCGHVCPEAVQKYNDEHHVEF